MFKIKNKVDKLKRVVKEIMYLRNNFSNWDIILKRAVNGSSTPLLILKNGMKILGVDNNSLRIYREIFIDKVYNPDGFEICENDIVFDVGANVGIFSMYASTFKGVHIYSFEPHPLNYSLLVKNVSMNNNEKITCVNRALGIGNETRYLIEGSIPGGHKLATMEEGGATPDLIKVETATLASVFIENNISKINFLKMDCEGAEGEIIRSLDSEGWKKIKKVAIEFHDNCSILKHDEILNILKSEGFTTNIKWDGKSYFGYIYGKKN
jgi:FkbM family methyltransferase